MPNALQLTAIYQCNDREPDAWHLMSAADELPRSLWDRFSLQYADARLVYPDSITVTLSREGLATLKDMYFGEADPDLAADVLEKLLCAEEAHDAGLAATETADAN